MEIAATWELAKQTVFQSLLHVHVKACMHALHRHGLTDIQ